MCNVEQAIARAKLIQRIFLITDWDEYQEAIRWFVQMEKGRLNREPRDRSRWYRSTLPEVKLIGRS